MLTMCNNAPVFRKNHAYMFAVVVPSNACVAASGGAPRCERRHFAFQKAVNYNAKGRLLEAKRRPFVTRWVTGGYAVGRKRAQKRRRAASQQPHARNLRS